jgi:hypothetical protein
MDESKESLEKLKISVNTSLLMAENYQTRCHEGETILTEFYLLHWWEFGKRKKTQKTLLFKVNIREK